MRVYDKKSSYAIEKNIFFPSNFALPSKVGGDTKIYLMPGGVVPKTKMSTKATTTQKAVTLYQINGKGEKVAKIGGASNEVEAALYALRIVNKAVKLGQKAGNHYLRKLNVSKAQEITFPSMEKNIFLSSRSVRLGQFVEYAPEVLTAVIEELTAKVIK